MTMMEMDAMINLTSTLYIILLLVGVACVTSGVFGVIVIAYIKNYIKYMLVPINKKPKGNIKAEWGQ